MGLIYTVTNRADGKLYVGKTLGTLKVRWANHVAVSRTKRGNSYLHKAIRKHGAEAFEVKEIATSDSPEELAELEKKFIRELNTFAPNGYNLTAGGEGVPGFVPSDETRRKIGLANRGRVFTDEQKKNISEGHLGLIHSESTKSKQRLAKLGRPRSIETRQAISESRKAFTHCKAGHEFTTENTYVRPDGRRKCVACAKRDDTARKDRLKQERKQRKELCPDFAFSTT